MSISQRWTESCTEFIYKCLYVYICISVYLYVDNAFWMWIHLHLVVYVLSCTEIRKIQNCTACYCYYSTVRFIRSNLPSSMSSWYIPSVQFLVRTFFFLIYFQNFQFLLLYCTPSIFWKINIKIQKYSSQNKKVKIPWVLLASSPFAHFLHILLQRSFVRFLCYELDFVNNTIGIISHFFVFCIFDFFFIFF
jgi:hypothetical protein